jgi:hypothetical protein
VLAIDNDSITSSPFTEKGIGARVYAKRKTTLSNHNFPNGNEPQTASNPHSNDDLPSTSTSKRFIKNAGIALLFTGQFLLFVFALLSWDIQEDKKREGWDQVYVTYRESNCHKTYVNNRRSTRCTLHKTYTYQGKTYSAVLREASPTSSRMERIDPDNPQNTKSIITEKSKTLVHVVGVISICLTLLGGLLLVLSLKRKKIHE